MPTIKVTPEVLLLDTQYTISGSGYEGPYIKVTVNYTNRAEMYKATVAPESNEHFQSGDFSLTEWAEEEGVVEFTVWDYPQRNVLASLKVECHGR